MTGVAASNQRTRGEVDGAVANACPVTRPRHALTTRSPCSHGRQCSRGVSAFLTTISDSRTCAVATATCTIPITRPDVIQHHRRVGVDDQRL